MILAVKIGVIEDLRENAFSEEMLYQQSPLTSAAEVASNVVNGRIADARPDVKF